MSLSSLAEEPASPCSPPPSLNQSCQTLLVEHFENNIPEIRIEAPSTSGATENLLMVPGTRVKCYKIPPNNDLCLCEDIFQQHQAKLVNCDSEDADAISRNRQIYAQHLLDNSNKPNFQCINPRTDVVRFQKRDQGTDAMSPKWHNRSLDSIKCEPEEDRFAGWVPLPGMRRCKSDFYLANTGEWKMINDVENELKDVYNEEVRVYNLNERQTECYKEIVEPPVSSTSTSECGCDNESVSPRSTDSSSESSETCTLKPTFSKEYPTSEDIRTDDNAKSSKLTAEERDLALKELDEIISGSFLKRISDFGRGAGHDETNRIKMSDFLQDMLKLDLSSLRTDSSSSSSSSSNNKTNLSSEDELLQFGCGRVAALAKHFSRMGEAGIIRGRGGNINREGKGRGLTSGGYRSEPNIANLTQNWLLNPYPDDVIIPASTTESDQISPLQMVFTSFGLHPIGFSMDRLLDIGNQGVVLKEIDNDKLDEEFFKTVEVKNKTKSSVEDVILEGNYDNPVSDSHARNMRFNSWTQTSDSIDLPDEHEKVRKSFNSLQEIDECCEKKLSKNVMTNFKKMSLSLDSYSNGLAKQSTIDPKIKSISVDEIELTKNRKPPLQKNFSIVNLDNIDRTNEEDLLEDDKVGVMSSVGCKRLNGFRERRGNFCSSEEISKQYGMKDLASKDGKVRKWLSVDEASPNLDKSVKAAKLDMGSIKDNLRKVQRSGEGMGRKLNRSKKVDQKMFVVSPWRFSEVTSRDGIMAVVSSDTKNSPSWGSRRNSVPATFLGCEMEEPFRKL